MRLAVLTGILLLVVVQYAGVGNANLNRIRNVCRSKYPVTPCKVHGWYRLNSKRCMKVFNFARTFRSAHGFCSQLGAQMVSIHNIKEYDRVLCRLVRNSRTMHHYWLGAMKRKRWWRWQDKKHVIFRRWAWGQPDNWMFRENCMEMNYKWWGRWNDENCGSRRRFLCSKRM
ncbi:C-type isolectin Sp-CL4-like [Genypterus blacodes]|uniref:C-type isolectin Sp-CL4-like n=1 Tax=Genypterus blacodes TaxID=154954 RepID=UPI003F75A29B